MMKRILLVLTILVLAIPLLGVEGHHAVLTEGGTYHTIEVVALDESAIPPRTALKLTTQRGEVTESTIVPGSDEQGMNFEPSLSWDEGSETLLLFWVRMPSMMSSEILFTSLHNGEWNDVVSIDNGTFHFRKNLRIAATHFQWITDDEGNTTREPGLSIHAAWWDEHSYGQDAQYAILNMEDGFVSSTMRFVLADLIDRSTLEPSILDPALDRSFFQVPVVTVYPGSDAVEVIFGDWDFGVLHKIDLTPIIANGVLTIPIGVRDPEPLRPEIQFANATTPSGSVEFITGGAGSGQLAAYWKSADSIIFSRYKEGTWSATRKVLLTDRVSMTDAIDGLRRLLGRD